MTDVISFKRSPPRPGPARARRLKVGGRLNLIAELNFSLFTTRNCVGVFAGSIV